MKKILHILLPILICILWVRCGSNENNENSFSQFPISLSLEGKPISFTDSALRVLGKADVGDSTYVFFMFKSDYFLTISDKDFNQFRDFGIKGNGPDELMGASLAGYDHDNGTYAIYDSYSNKMYVASDGTTPTLNEEIQFPESFNKFTPIKVVKLANNKFVGARGDFRYGLVSYDAEADKVDEWPIGEGFDSGNPVSEEVSMRVVQYNKDKGIIAEIYGSCPDLILHKEDGTIIRQVKYSGYDPKLTSEGQKNKCFYDMVLSDNYIWLLYANPDESEINRVFCLNYEGHPIAELIIEPASTIAIDEGRQRLLALDPSKEERNLMTYDISDIINNSKSN